MAIKLLSENGISSTEVSEYIVDYELEKDSIPIEDKVFGTRCFVGETGKQYRLDSGLNWIEEGNIDDDSSGGSVPSIIVQSLTVTQNGTSTASEGRAYSPVIVNVANSYTVDDEGKVVSNGALIAQTTHARVTEDGIVDTTYNNSVEIAVASGLNPTAEKKDVNFIDYDGTIRYSYTADEFTNLSDLPPNPSHMGLIAQGWNWTKSQIIAQLTAMPNAPVWVGQMYITSSGKTEIDIILPELRTSPYLAIAIDGTVTVDWGDNLTSTITGDDLTTTLKTKHNYASAGKYTITIRVDNGSFTFSGSTTNTILTKSSSNLEQNRVYSSCIQAIRLGSGITNIDDFAFGYCYNLMSVTIPSSITNIGTYAFSCCYSLRSVTIPSNVTNIDDYAFFNCYSLISITMPSSITLISSYMFYQCYNLINVTIPNNVTNIYNSAFFYCYSLANISIPNNVTDIYSSAFSCCYSLASVSIPSSVINIGSSAFYSCGGIAQLHFKSATPPTISGANAFSNIPTDCIIYVPSGRRTTYMSTTNYPNSNEYTYIEEA